MRGIIAIAFAAVLATAGSAAAAAQDFPSRPITLIAPFPAGGPTDTLARIMGERMKASLGQTVIVENVTGAGGTIGTARVAHAPPDGYTIGIGNWTSHIGSVAIYPFQFDVFKDLEPIALLTFAPLWIVGKNALPPKSANELVAWLKSNPNPTPFATVGAGSAAHLCGIYFEQKTGAHFQYVPYRGAAPIMQDLIGGQIDLSCLEASATLPNVTAGKFKAFAVMSEQRWSKSPDTPTMTESGAPGLSVAFWHGFWAPKGTPKDIIARLDDAVREAFADPAVQQKLGALGQIVATREQQTPAGLAAFHKAEADKWWPIIKAAGIKPQ
jgi:tripartite-type tricarboxylate transporter receptor subunit TctC